MFLQETLNKADKLWVLVFLQIDVKDLRIHSSPIDIGINIKRKFHAVLVEIKSIQQGLLRSRSIHTSAVFKAKHQMT